MLPTIASACETMKFQHEFYSLRCEVKFLLLLAHENETILHFKICAVIIKFEENLCEQKAEKAFR